MRQEYTLSFLQTILNHYNEETIEETKLFTSGYENSNYYIKTAKHEYVIKIFEGEGFHSDIISFEADVINTCNYAGILTPKVYHSF